MKSFPQKCKICNSYGHDLHHISYDNLGNEADEDLCWLCRDCHTSLHKKYGKNPPLFVINELRYRYLRKLGIGLDLPKLIPIDQIKSLAKRN